MNPQDALALIDQAVASVVTDRNGHTKLQEALGVLAEAIKKPSKKQ